MSSTTHEISSFFLWDPNVHYHVHNSPPLVPVSIHINPVHGLPSFFSNIHFNIIFPSSSTSSKWLLSLRFPHQNPVCNCCFSHTCHIPSPSPFLLQSLEHFLAMSTHREAPRCAVFSSLLSTHLQTQSAFLCPSFTWTHIKHFGVAWA